MAACAGRLETDKQNCVLGIGHALRQVMQDASPGRHAAVRSDDGRRVVRIDFLGLFRVEANVKPDHSSGDPDWRIRLRVS
jgi:hypothetical protein